jgi:hypothetical protein
MLKFKRLKKWQRFLLKLFLGMIGGLFLLAIICFGLMLAFYQGDFVETVEFFLPTPPYPPYMRHIDLTEPKPEIVINEIKILFETTYYLSLVYEYTFDKYGENNSGPELHKKNIDMVTAAIEGRFEPENTTAGLDFQRPHLWRVTITRLLSHDREELYFVKTVKPDISTSKWWGGRDLPIILAKLPLKMGRYKVKVEGLNIPLPIPFVEANLYFGRYIGRRLKAF